MNAAQYIFKQAMQTSHCLQHSLVTYVSGVLGEDKTEENKDQQTTSRNKLYWVIFCQEHESHCRASNQEDVQWPGMKTAKAQVWKQVLTAMHFKKETCAAQEFKEPPQKLSLSVGSPILMRHMND